MHSTLLIAALALGQSGVAPPPVDQRPLPAPQLHPDAKSDYPEIEEVVGRPEFDPRKRAKDNPVMVHTHVLFYWSGGKKRIMKVKWINTEARPNTMVAVPHIDFYPMNRLKSPVIVLVEGQLTAAARP